MRAALFVTGTDTGIGKTWISAGLVRGMRQLGIDAVGMKPVASGCEPAPDGWRNEDALALLEASGLGVADYGAVNPVALPRPASPHLAAMDHGVRIDPALLADRFNQLRARHEFVVVEGAGGWSVPLAGPSPSWILQADLVRRLALPALLVVGLRLGCINHAMLSARAIAADGVRLLGWVGNQLAPDDDQRDVLATLDALLSTPALAVVPHGVEPDAELASTVLGLV